MKAFLWSRFAPTVLSLSLVAVSSARAGQEALAPAPATERPTVYLDQGDGLTINAAIRQLPEGGGVIVLGPNLFPVSEAIVIDRDGVELRGIGRETILRLTDGANSSVIVVGSTTTPVARIVRNISVSHLSIDGNRGAQQFEFVRR